MLLNDFWLRTMKTAGNRSIRPVTFNPRSPGYTASVCQPGEAEKHHPTPKHSSINKGQRKGTLGLSGDCRRGKLAHIKLIRGPQSPLTFASQSQVAHCLCYRLDYVSSALNSLVQIVLKAERKSFRNLSISPDFRTTDSVCFYSLASLKGKSTLNSHLFCVWRFIIDLGNSNCLTLRGFQLHLVVLPHGYRVAQFSWRFKKNENLCH